MLIIGSHVSFKKDSGLLGSLEEALSYNSNAFMFYTGAPQNTNRAPIDDKKTYEALEIMKEKDIKLDNVIVHAPYIVNLANRKKEEQYDFSINFLIQECSRCEELFVKKLVLHPGSHVGCGTEEGIKNIANALNQILPTTTTKILLETMAGKGTEIGSNFDELKSIIDLVDESQRDKVGICLDTCHLSDAGYDVKDFDKILDTLESKNLLSRVLCIHVNDSKNEVSSHKDRHENIGFGYIGFDNLINIIYNKRLENIPKILETPYVLEYPPYKYEIDMIRKKEFNKNLKEEIQKQDI